MKTLVACITVAGILSGPTSSARADVYDDAKDIIRELVERNIAKEAIPNAAAKVDLLCDYFPSSLAALQELRFNGLSKVIHKEIADAIGFRLLVSLSKPDPAQRSGPNVFLQPVDAADPLPPRPPTPAPAPAPVGGRVAAPPPPPPTTVGELWIVAAEELSNDKRKANKPKANRCARLPEEDPKAKTPPPFSKLQSIASEALDKCVEPREDFDQEVACAMSLLARDAAMLDDKGVRRDVQRAAVAILLKVEAAADVGQLKPLTQALLQALRSGKLDYQTIEKLIQDGLLKTGTNASEVWLKLADAVNTQADLSFDEAMAVATSLMQRCGATCTRFLTALKVEEIRKLIRFLKAKDFGGAADVAIQMLVDAASLPKDSNEKKALVFVQRFTVYTIDSIQAGSASESVSANFRSAAVELIEAYSGLGIHRYTWTPGALLYPRFSLRKASRPGRGSLDAIEYPSLDLLNVVYVPPYLFSEWFYASLNLSVVDVLGPFVELAVRSPSLNRKSSKEVFLLGFFTPRLDLNIGIPALTKNVVVGAGIAARLYRSTADGMNYCRAGACGEDDLNANNLEYSVFVKYVP